MTIEIEPRCFANHMGIYACEPRWLERTVAAIRSGLWKPEPVKAAIPGSQPGRSFAMADGGIAIIPIVGGMTKGASKFSQADTIRIRRQVREASRDKEVRGILLHVDSPGGFVDGTDDLAREVRGAGSRKPVHAYIEDTGASAAYWVASQASRITANPTAAVGSIGVFTVVYDLSKNAEMEGVRVHVIATGPNKGAGVPGSEVTKEQLAALQEEVDGVASHFFEAVRRGRRMGQKQLEAVTDGRVWTASRAGEEGIPAAVDLKLVDAIGTDEDAIEALREASAPRERAKQSLDLERLGDA